MARPGLVRVIRWQGEGRETNVAFRQSRQSVGLDLDQEIRDIGRFDRRKVGHRIGPYHQTILQTTDRPTVPRHPIPLELQRHEDLIIRMEDGLGGVETFCQQDNLDFSLPRQLELSISRRVVCVPSAIGEILIECRHHVGRVVQW